MDDLEWNRALDSIGSPRQGLSPEEIAYRWNQKQEADRLAAEWCTYERLWESNEEPSVLPQREETGELGLAEVRRFAPPIENDPKKAAKWRRKARLKLSSSAASGEPKMVEEGVASNCAVPAVEPDASQVDLLENCGKSRASRRPTRGSRRSKALSVYTLNATGKVAAIDALKELAASSKSIAAVAVQEHHCVEEAT